VQDNSANRLDPADILTPEQLAERLQVRVSWVYEKSRARGEHGRKPLPVMRCGRYLRFFWPDVCQWMRNGKPEVQK
jgi:predicted DNA-binding transcriptional regulator AlpA